jgi:hypothetical protein
MLAPNRIVKTEKFEPSFPSFTFYTISLVYGIGVLTQYVELRTWYARVVFSYFRKKQKSKDLLRLRLDH